MILKNWDTNNALCLRKIVVQKIVYKSSFIEPVIIENVLIFKLILTEITLSKIPVHNDSQKYEIEFKTHFPPIPKATLNFILFLWDVLFHNMHLVGAKND